MDSQDSFADLVPLPEMSEPATPQPSHATIPESTAVAISKVQSNRIENASSGMTPPPSSQRAKTRTPTPTVSHISTPPPTIEAPSQSQTSRVPAVGIDSMSAEEVTSASPEQLRTKVTELQAALHEAKMSAAHHKLQYRMLSQETAEKIERMAVEARMTQHENDVIHIAEQARAAATPVPRPVLPEGMIPVQKDLYQRMLQDIQKLTDTNRQWEREYSVQEKVIGKQESEIASLSDKVTLMRERIQENRDHLNKMRARNNGTSTSRLDSTPRSIYATPQRSNGLDALLQASEMTQNQTKGHRRNTHSMSSFPSTPQHQYKHKAPNAYQTPSGRQPPMKVPSTAPMPRTSAMRTLGHANRNVYEHPSLPVSVPHTRGPPSEGTVSASDREDGDDSEAETDIIDPEDGDTVTESQASRAASQMLKGIQEKRESFKGSGILARGSGSDGGMRQSKLFGAVRKANVDRGLDPEGPPAKRARVEASPAQSRAGLGISGVRE